MKRIFAAICLLGILILANIANAAVIFPGAKWESVSPKEAGFDEEKLAIARQEAGKLNLMGGGMVLYDGKVLMEWGDVKRKGDVYSVRKSLISALYGIYSDEGKINLNASMAQLGIDDKGGLTEQEKQATVLDLLKARSGIYHEAAYETPNMKKTRPVRGSAAPGTNWYYNNWDFNVLGTIFEKYTGQKIGDCFNNRIAIQIGMQDFSPSDVSSYYDPVSIHRAYPFKMTARDMARFGLLYMRDGKWEDKQIIPLKWIKESTTGYSSVSPGLKYGYLWWVNNGALLGSKIDGPAYRAQGTGGQYIVVIPKDKLVIVNAAYYPGSMPADYMAKPFSQFVKYLLAAKTAH